MAEGLVEPLLMICIHPVTKFFLLCALPLPHFPLTLRLPFCHFCLDSSLVTFHFCSVVPYNFFKWKKLYDWSQIIWIWILSLPLTSSMILDKIILPLCASVYSLYNENDNLVGLLRRFSELNNIKLLELWLVCSKYYVNISNIDYFIPCIDLQLENTQFFCIE